LIAAYVYLFEAYDYEVRTVEDALEALAEDLVK